MKSSVWDEKLVCLTCTIPEDATSICVGFRSYGYPAKTIVSLKNVYMYDLQEEVSIEEKIAQTRHYVCVELKKNKKI